MKYIIYAAVAVLICWSAWYVAHQIRRQLRGQSGCDGNCSQCGYGSCGRAEKK